MSGLTEFNLNNYIYVKLTQKGKDELKRQHDDLVSNYPNYISPYIPPKEDEHGYSKFQMWVLMKNLGHLCVIGLELPFETEVKLENKDK